MSRNNPRTWMVTAKWRSTEEGEPYWVAKIHDNTETLYVLPSCYTTEGEATAAGNAFIDAHVYPLSTPYATLREVLIRRRPTPAEGAALLADALHLAGAERYPSLSPACYLVEGDLSSLDGIDALRDYPLGSEKRDVLVTLVHDLVNGDLSAAEVHVEVDSLGE